MSIRRANELDIPQIEKLLDQVLDVHHAGRPDLFRPHTRKYTTGQLRELVLDDRQPIFVYVESTQGCDLVLGYAFCIWQQHLDDNVLTDIRTLYIDDLCVEQAARGKHVGTRLYEHVLDYARSHGFYNVTLNVWALNHNAKAFYEHLGMQPQKYGMEVIL